MKLNTTKSTIDQTNNEEINPGKFKVEITLSERYYIESYPEEITDSRGGFDDQVDH